MFCLCFPSFVSGAGLTVLILCDETFPSVLSFAFLSEIQKEFLLSYDTTAIKKARRPYAFIEFGN